MKGGTRVVGWAPIAGTGGPQWSRPVKGGTRVEPVTRYVDRSTVPQWSRPVKGGTSEVGRTRIGGVALAAMEPPGEGRYERTHAV